MQFRINIATAIIFLQLFLIVPARTVFANDCKSIDLTLHVLGSGGPELDDGRGSSSYYLASPMGNVLLDVGPGSSLRLDEMQLSFADVDAILLSHLHVDHSADLPAYIKGSYFTNRRQDLIIAGPSGNHLMPGTIEFVDSLFGDNGAFRYLNDYLVQGQESYQIVPREIDVNKSKLVELDLGEGIRAQAIATHHGPNPAVAWKVIIANCEVVYTGDMSSKSTLLPKFATGADLLIIHHAVPEGAGQIARNLHKTPSQIADLLSKANPKNALVSHFMNRTQFHWKKTKTQLQKSYKGNLIEATDKLQVKIN